MNIEKRIHKLFKWEVPSALPGRETSPDAEFTWQDWIARMKSKYPIRYFLMESVPDFIHGIWHDVDRKLYWFRSVTYKKQHLLDLRQPKDAPLAHSYRWGYSDITQRMIYAMFAFVIIYIEKELDGPEETQKWIDELKSRHEDAPIYQIRTMEEALRIYKWWKGERVAKLKMLDSMLDEWYLKRHSSGANELHTKLTEAEEAFENELNDMMKALIDIRQGMWT
jgi:hypothetical protein